MKKTNPHDLKMLLMQVRKDKPSQDQETNAFVALSGLAREQFMVWKVFEQPNFSVHQLTGFDAVFIGGSSDDPTDSTTLDEERFPFITDAMAVIRFCRTERIPVFASCMGFEIALQAFDAPLIFDYENAELGFADIEITAAGKADPLLGTIPNGCYAVSCHKKRAAELPTGAVLLAASKKCPIHAFTFPGTNFYAFQFHPEWTDTALLEIFERYADRYPGGLTTLEQMKRDQKPTTVANSLVRTFVERTVL